MTKPRLDQGADYERGFVDGAQHQMQSNVDKAVNRMAQQMQEPLAWEQFYPDFGKPQIAFNAEVIGYVAPQRTWVGLTNEEKHEIRYSHMNSAEFIEFIESKLKDKNTSEQE